MSKWWIAILDWLLKLKESIVGGYQTTDDRARVKTEKVWRGSKLLSKQNREFVSILNGVNKSKWNGYKQAWENKIKILQGNR